MSSQLAEMIRAVTTIAPEQPELEFEGRWQTWEQLSAQAAALDAALREEGLGADVRIGVLLRNRPQFVPLLMCLFSTDRCLASVNATAPTDKLIIDIEKVQAPVIVATADDWARPGVREAAASTGAAGLSLEPDNSILKVVEADPSRWTNVNAPGVAIEMLSSGTTGTPKRIPLPARNFEKALMSAASYEKGREPDAPPKLRSGVQIVTAPLAHVSGMTGVMNNLLAGRKICLIDKFTVDAFVDAVVRHRPKIAGAPPSALRMILDADVPKEKLSSLVAYRTGTAPLDPALADAFYEKYGIPVLQNYGATEFAGGAAGWTLEDFKAHWKDKYGAVGRLNRGAEARTVSPETGEVLPLGEEGLLEIRAPNIGNGKDWVRTTDLAVVDADRFMWIKGRYDGAIIRGGFKILPDDVIRALEAHPAVREAMVVGLPDRRLGEVPVAAYLRRAEADAPDPAELNSFLRERLMPYQVPVRIVELAEFPRTPSMKVALPALKTILSEAAEA